MKEVFKMESNRNSNAKNGGIGFCGALTLIFITLKLTNLVDWSWVWVAGTALDFAHSHTYYTVS